MFIYTVKPGDSLYAISQKYQIPIEDIRLANGLSGQNLAIGQALFMNTSTYVVQPGDTFYAIAKMSYVPLETLLQANPTLNPNRLDAGTRVNLPKFSPYSASSFCYMYITGTSQDLALIRDFAPYTTYYSFFEYHFTSDGSLNALDDLRGIEASWNNRCAPLATITNLTASGFSSQVTNQVLSNRTSRENLINNIYHVTSSRGYKGVNIDFENLLTEDRENFSLFLQELRGRLKRDNLLLTVAVPPKSSEEFSWLRGFDYRAIGAACDLVFIMAYDWHHRSSEPGPVAPLNEIQKTIAYATGQMENSKILIGVPLYGYDWVLPYNPANLASTVSNQQAVDLARNAGATIEYSEASQSPYFHYTDQNGQQHVVWFEDSRSMAEKMLLIRNSGLDGLGAWQINLGFPQGPWLLTTFFTVKKVV
ncbi:glycosyl hydrolase family 18 protein [Camelliibacillus cellulosilyticus]|uniref:Glycosyl hydrolase family 18 protein n=1 Tax=Camelliibacillus cellulosilyticus TaxID=2174486 RepID=A0ABV9GH91_9BACL